MSEAVNFIYDTLDVFSGKKKPVKDEPSAMRRKIMTILEIDGVPVPLQGTKMSNMTKQNMKEAQETFLHIMDDMDYRGVPDEFEIYKNIREIFDLGVKVAQLYVCAE
jgi:hypothetical protein